MPRVPPPKTHYHVEPLSREEVAALLEQCNRGPTGIRGRALITLMYRGMLRINEALHLRPADVDFRNGEVRVLHGKGGKARTIAMNQAGLELVNHWLEKRHERDAMANSNWLFCTLDGKPLDQPYVRKLLKRLKGKAGIVKRVHPHGLRHSGACEMRRAGVHIAIISKALGHASIATTAIYLDHIAPEDVAEAMRGMTW